MDGDTPFDLVHDALWKLLMARPSLHSAVRVENRVAFDKDAPLKDQVSDTDLPEMRLVPIGGAPHLYCTSSSSSCTKIWELQIATGEQSLERLFFLEWETFCAMKDWLSVLTALLWHDESFVKNVSMTAYADGAARSDLNRGIRGWSTVWRCEVEMFFATKEL